LLQTKILRQAMDKAGQHGIASSDRATHVNLERFGKKSLVLADQDAAVAAHGNENIDDAVLSDQLAAGSHDRCLCLQPDAKSALELVDVGLDQGRGSFETFQEQDAIGIEDALAGGVDPADQLAVKISGQTLGQAAGKDNKLALGRQLVNFSFDRPDISCID